MGGAAWDAILNIVGRRLEGLPLWQLAVLYACVGFAGWFTAGVVMWATGHQVDLGRFAERAALFGVFFRGRVDFGYLRRRGLRDRQAQGGPGRQF
jgi:hypothetical protein